MARILRKYAASLFQMAKEQNLLESLYTEANNILENNESIKSNSLSNEMSSFMIFILENDIEPVLYSFTEMARKELGILKLEITTAFKLSKEQESRIASRLEKSSNKKVEVFSKHEPDLLGGIKIVIGEKMFDYTIKSQLEQIKSEIHNSGVTK